MFVLGDSLFDAGNNQYLPHIDNPAPGTFWPYGMNNHNRSTGRLSDGLLVPDFIAQYAGINILPPYLKPGANFTYGANFASAGAGVLDVDNGFMNLNAQLSNFKKFVNSLAHKVGEAEAKKVLMRSVYLFSLGGNDYFSFNTRHPHATTAERRDYVHMVLGNLTHGLKELYGLGMRKLAVQNVGPLGCYPTIKFLFPEMNVSCIETFLTHAKMHNEALSNALKTLQEQLPGFKYGIFDYYHALYDRMKNPTEYGFTVGQVACCGSGLYNGRGCGRGDDFNLCSNPNEFVLFDGGHHTQRTNIQLAQLTWNGPPNVTGPCTVKQLFELP
ncbi:zinc finger protein, putative [Ricinus communis]|uniref:Zinc finger protein, putative n=2 Tax=Ricinus communis TaxID=3988 RepID=B9T8L6_RICCO|nr:zinc finger protein, putative [Ricinus communis]|eukprot:XP_002534585.1 GDSL esterase/lipase 1 [Ricinus communis]